jgi:Raf kinase inhibitor-like YbhB/YbcL family protein
MTRLVAWASCAIALGLSGCGGHEASAPPSPSSAIPSPSGETSFAVTSRALSSGTWPSADTCDGGDGVPDLHWTAGPPGTRSYALQLFDVDAPHGGFTHWMLANEPADLREPTPGTGVSGRNDFGREGYAGPCPPKGSRHRYIFTVYAVDASLSLRPLYSHAEFQKALETHVLTQATLVATYAR